MAASDLTVTGNLVDALGTAYDYARTKVWVTFNTANERVTDDEGVVRFDAGAATVNADGSFTIAGIPKPGDSNPTSFQVKIHFDAPPRLAGVRGGLRHKRGDFGWMTITEDAVLADLEDEQSIPAEYQTAFTDAAQAYLDAQAEIAGIDDTDSAVAALIEDDMVGPLTNAALSASTAAIAAPIADARAGGAALRFTNDYVDFFNSQDSVANPSAWADDKHPTTAYLGSWATHVLTAADITETAPKIVWFLNSWGVLSPSTLTTATTTAIPGATVEVYGNSGYTAPQLLAVFDAQVDSDADYVIFNEPGVNSVFHDDYGTSAHFAADLALLVAKCRAIGAIPVFTGPPPLSGLPVKSLARYTELVALIGDGKQFPAVPPAAALVPTAPETLSLGVGGGLSRRSTGLSNTTFGVSAGDVLTTGGTSTFIGSEAGKAASTGSDNTGLGSSALRAQTTGLSATGLGANAGRNNTSSYSTFVGAGAGYNPGGSSSKASTTGQGQTVVGALAGQGSSTARNYITCIGQGTQADGSGAVAIGVDNAGGAASATAQNDFVLGTANHTVRIPGKFALGTAFSVGTTAKASLNVPAGVAPTTPVDGDVWTTTTGVFARVNGVTQRLSPIVATGTATLVGGTVTVTDAAITANSVIRVTNRTIGGTPGALYISAKTASTSFAITSTSATDTSVVQYDVVSY